MVWEDNTPGNTDIFFRGSNQFFGSTVNISNSFGMILFLHKSQQLVIMYMLHGLKLLLVTLKSFLLSYNNGKSFNSPINLSNNGGSLALSLLFHK